MDGTTDPAERYLSWARESRRDIDLADREVAAPASLERLDAATTRRANAEFRLGIACQMLAQLGVDPDAESLEPSASTAFVAGLIRDHLLTPGTKWETAQALVDDLVERRRIARSFQRPSLEAFIKAAHTWAAAAGVTYPKRRPGRPRQPASQ